MSDLVSKCSPPFFGFAGAILAGVERSDCEKRIKMFIRKVMRAIPTAENAIPFHEYKSEDQWRNFKAP